MRSSVDSCGGSGFGGRLLMNSVNSAESATARRAGGMLIWKEYCSQHCVPNRLRFHPMIRRVFLFSLLLCVTPALAQPPATRSSASPTAAAAKSTFEQLQNQWKDLYVALAKKSNEKKSGSAGRGEVDQEIDQLTAEIEGMVDKIVAAGVAVHKAGVTDDAMINSTLTSIAGFYITGDAQGDGGDQYEKALPLIKQMLASGLGEQSKELWLWGGVAAFNLNDFSLAQQYFSQAESKGLLGMTPPGKGRSDPLNRVWQLARKQVQDLPTTRTAWQQEQAIRAREAAADNLPRVVLHTSRGNVTIELFEDDAPIAVANFLNLVKGGFYDGVVFHRVLPAFMAQGGDPTGTGSGGPGYNIRCECHDIGYRKHFRGSLSMAHAGRDTGGSQFFLTFVPTSYLDGKHTVFRSSD